LVFIFFNLFIPYNTLLFSRLSETLDRFSKKLESVYQASGGKKINLITHSMGGLLVKCFVSLHGDVSTSLSFGSLLRFSKLIMCYLQGYRSFLNVVLSPL
jgi:poly(3-hydroxyalkanoate) synthetase